MILLLLLILGLF